MIDRKLTWILSTLTHFLMQEWIIRLPNGIQRHARISKNSTGNGLEDIT